MRKALAVITIAVATIVAKPQLATAGRQWRRGAGA